MNSQDNTFETVNCTICQSDSYLTYSTKGQFGLPTYVVICKKCGFSYLNPRWNKKRYDHFYTVEYDNYYRPEVKTSYNYDQYSSIKAILKRLEKLNLKPSGPDNILDIGSGMGDSLKYLKENIFPEANYFAIEPSDFCIENLKKNGIEILSKDVDSNWQNGNENKYDFIIMRHVLEHFLDPISVLKKASAVLKPGGILFVAVPNAKKPTKRLKAHYFRVVHVSYFSPLSLSNAFALSGLNATIMKDGDEFDQYEIYAIVSKTSQKKEIAINSTECIIQEGAYNKIKRLDFYYDFKAFVWKILQSFRKK